MKRYLGVSDPSAWLIQLKLLQAIANREARYVLDVNVKLDDAYLGGECMDGKVGGGSENKVVFVVSVSLTVEYLPFRVRLTRVPGFTLQPVAA